MRDLKQIIASNRAGNALALPSVCSAQPDVLAASLLLAQSLDRDLLIEATSNQVNQYGGYTGMRPDDFIRYVKALAAENNVDMQRVHFGGDHLGPQVWRSETADIAIGHARVLMRSYVEAGFTKIHLDCSEGCKDEPAQVDDETSAHRAAELAAVCEKHAPDPTRLTYVIGTEVPPPGGARADEVGPEITPTPPERAHHTLECHRRAFAEQGLSGIWGKIIGLVVQPGLEFAPMHVDHFNMASPNHLSAALRDDPHICFEAHSTDYQHDAVFAELARRNFAVLKVGPALTFAYRQAIYALDHIRARLQPDQTGTAVSQIMETLMVTNPQYWHNHYDGGAKARHLQRHFGYADRIRYYWPEKAARLAVAELISDLAGPVAADPLLRQYFTEEVIERAETLKTGEGWAGALVLAQIQSALDPYFFESD